MNAAFNKPQNAGPREPRFTDVNYKTSFAPAAPQVETGATDTSIEVAGTETKTLEAGQRIVTRTSGSNCPSYNKVNSSTERDALPIEIPRIVFEARFEAHRSKPNVTKGSKTVQSSDGSENGDSWDLTLCDQP